MCIQWQMIGVEVDVICEQGFQTIALDASDYPSLAAPEPTVVHKNRIGPLGNGQIEGDVRASALTVGETGAVKGEVIAESVVVRGTVEGRIRGRKVQLCTGAKVRGDIFHASLAIEPNAIFEGAVKHAQDPMADPPTGT